ncbi:MAG TPA: alpha/beta hydrolase [Bacteriovoracaceae bacterium]|nr:alpha/beta hydrolase [Bacteriovoracaceae bacterium]
MKCFDHQSNESLNHAGASIYYETSGEAGDPALLLLHGGFGNLEDFNHVIPHLKKKFYLIGMDSRGQGRSTLGSLPLSYELLQSDVEHVLGHLGRDEVSIMGMSDGGIVAYRLALGSSVKVGRIISNGSRWHIKNTSPSREMLLNTNGKGWIKKLPSAFAAYTRLNPDPDFDRLSMELTRMWLDPSTSGYPNELIKNVGCPLLAVRGDKDPYLPLAALEELASLLDDCHLHNMPFAAHAAFQEQTELFMLSANHFLDL